MRTAAIARWASNGVLDDLVSTARRRATELGAGASVAVIGHDLVFRGVDPIRLGGALKHLPGVRWVAAGFEFSSEKDFGRALKELASRYIRKNTRFNLEANVGGSARSAEDIERSAVSGILEMRRGSPADDDSATVRLRLTMRGRRGVIGVIIRDGVAGVPTSASRSAYCLASGGRHSAAAAWLGTVRGLSVRLVHFYEGAPALRAVARLYSEISNRADPTGLGLEVVRAGNDPAAALAAWWKRKRPWLVLTGLHLECKDPGYAARMLDAPKGMCFPVAFLSEEEVRRTVDELGTRAHEAAAPYSLLLRASRAAPKITVAYFGGTRADANEVLDAVSA